MIQSYTDDITIRKCHAIQLHCPTVDDCLLETAWISDERLQISVVNQKCPDKTYRLTLIWHNGHGLEPVVHMTFWEKITYTSCSFNQWYVIENFDDFQRAFKESLKYLA